MHWFELYNRITLCLVFVIKLTIQEDFTVYRTVNSGALERPWKLSDKFKISEAKCRETLDRNENPCLEYGSFTQGKTCFCNCPHASPTFIYKRNSSKCVHVKATRASRGCGFLFDGESEKAGLLYLTPTYRAFLMVPSKSSQCNVNELTSEYLDCGSNWKPLTNITRSNIFQLASNVNRNHQYEIKINWRVAFSDLSGFIIKLGLTCQPQNGSPCIMFKITGKFKCPIGSSVPPSTSSSTKVISTDPFPTMESFETDASTSASTLSTSKPHHRNRKDEFTTTAIAGVVISIVLFISLALALAFIGIRFRNKRIKRQAAEVQNGVGLPRDVATQREVVTMETGQVQNEDYEEINQLANSNYTNLTRSKQGTYETPSERAFTESNETDTRNAKDYQDLIQCPRPSFESSYEPLRRTSKRNNVKEEVLPHRAQTESPLNGDEDYEHMELRDRNTEQTTQLKAKRGYENCDSGYHNVLH